MLPRMNFSLTPMIERPALKVAVLIERRKQPSPWEDWGFRIAEVCIDDGGFGSAARTLRDDGDFTQWLFPGLPVTLYRDEAEGYHLNLSTGQPVWFVMWRIDADDPSRAWPELVTAVVPRGGAPARCPGARRQPAAARRGARLAAGLRRRTLQARAQAAPAAGVVRGA